MSSFPGKDTAKPRFNAMSKYAKPTHKAAARALGYVLTLGTQDAWWGLVPVLVARLSVEERALLAFMALWSLDDDTAHKTASAAICGGAGQPIAPLFNHMDEAAFWADMAEPDELDAYVIASFNRMAPERQAAFLSFAQGRAAA